MKEPSLKEQLNVKVSGQDKLTNELEKKQPRNKDENHKIGIMDSRRRVLKERAVNPVGCTENTQSEG